MQRCPRPHVMIAALLAVAPLAMGQSQPAPSAGAAPGQTLESASDARLLNELADRGLDSLLTRYFDVHHTPPSEQRAIRSTQALRDLSDPKLSNAERQQKISQVVDGLSATLPNLRDPMRLAKDAALLLDYGVTRDANLLEYWGENPTTQARLRPVAEAVWKMLGQAAAEARGRADALMTKINGSNQSTLGTQWDQLDNLAKTAEYSQNMMVYYVALSLPRAERAKVAEPAIKYLGQLDNADSQVQPRVRVMLAKLNLVAGNFDEATRIFESIINDSKHEIQPPPGLDQQYEARYFENVAKLEAGQIKEAVAGLDDLIAWQKSAMPKDEGTQRGIAAAAEMLRYRIDLAEADRASDAVARKSAETAATNVLLKLSTDRPDLKGIIYQQLAERLPKDAPVSGMDALLLQGLMAKAYAEASKPPGPGTDRQAIRRGLEASAEVLKRRGAGGITPTLLDEAARLTPFLLEANGDKVQAANEYLRYAQQNASINLPAAQGVLDDAGRLTFELHKSMPEDPQVSDLYDRFLPTAIGRPFNRTTLAFFYAQRLRLQNKPQEAVKYYQMVPREDKSYATAQYYMLQALQDMLGNPKLPDSQRAVTAAQLVRQAEQVRQAYADGKDDVARERAALATLAEAKAVGGEQKRPRQTLQLLENFDQAVRGTPDEKALVGDALLTRVNAYMALGQLKQATDTLVSLLNQTGGAQGADFVRGLLDRLDKDLEKAEAAQNTQAMRDVALSEANLSGFLVEWARNNSIPEIKRYTYQYMVFDARTKRLAGALEPDPQQKRQMLQAALEAYRRLQQPANLALYKATLDVKAVSVGNIDPDQPDPNVQLGVALTEYEMGEYKDAAELLGTLLNGGKLGGPTRVVQDPGTAEPRVVDNDIYWEATYKLYRSNVEAARSAADSAATAAAPDATKQGLKNLLVRGGIPDKWQPQFDDLRRQIIPDFNLAELSARAATQPAATASTQPVSSR